MIGNNVYWERLTAEEKLMVQEAGRLVGSNTGLGIVKQVVKSFPELNSRYMKEIEKNKELVLDIQKLEMKLKEVEERKKEEQKKIKDTIFQYFNAKNDLKKFIEND